MLPDYLAPNLRAVICGVAASRRSGELGRYYAGPGNRFWPVLHEAGLVRAPLRVGDEADLFAQGIGLTDIAKGVSGMDHQIDPRAGLGLRQGHQAPGPQQQHRQPVA